MVDVPEALAWVLWIGSSPEMVIAQDSPSSEETETLKLGCVRATAALLTRVLKLKFTRTAHAPVDSHAPAWGAVQVRPVTMRVASRSALRSIGGFLLWAGA